MRPTLRFLSDVRARAPAGFDVVIDHASHEAQPTARSLAHLLFDHARPDGVYIIEDWITGYLANFPDGAPYSGVIDSSSLGEGESGTSLRLPSDDHGMVGLIKRLIDHTAAPTIATFDCDEVGRTLPIESMTIHGGVVALRARAIELGAW